MQYKLYDYEISQLIENAAERGAELALESIGYKRMQVNQTKAWEIYTRSRVESWVKKGWIKPVKQGRHTLYNLSKLRELATRQDFIIKKREGACGVVSHS